MLIAGQLLACGASPAPVDTTRAYDADEQMVADRGPAEERQPVVELPPRPPYRNDLGPGWRLVDGRFQSAATGLEIQDGGGWSFVEDAADTAAPAEFALEHERGYVFMAFGGEMFREVDDALVEELRQTLFGQVGEPVAEEPRSVEVQLRAGASEETLTMRRHESEQLGLFVGLRRQGSRVHFFQLMYPPGQADAAKLAFAQLPELRLIEDEPLAALRAELSRLPQRLSAAATLVNGQFVDFDAGVRAQLPEGLWQTRMTTGVILQANEVVKRVSFTLGRTLSEDTSAADAHQMLRGQLFGDAEVARATRVRFAGLRGLISEADVGEGLARERRRAISVVRGEDIVWWTVTAPIAAFEAGQSLIEEVQRSVRFEEPSDPLQRQAQAVRDRRLGLAFEVPEGFTMDDPIRPPTHGVYLLRKDEAEIAVFAFPAHHEAPTHIARLRDRTRDQLGEPAEESETSILWPEGQTLEVREVGGLKVVVINLGGGGVGEAFLQSLAPVSL